MVGGQIRYPCTMMRKHYCGYYLQPSNASRHWYRAEIGWYSDSRDTYKMCGLMYIIVGCMMRFLGMTLVLVCKLNLLFYTYHVLLPHFKRLISVLSENHINTKSQCSRDVVLDDTILILLFFPTWFQMHISIA